MQHLSISEVRQRFADILSNITTLTASGQIGLISPPEAHVWIKLQTHVMEELKLRNGPYPAGYDSEMTLLAQLPKPTFPHVKKGALDLAEISQDGAFRLFRYGELGHLQDTLLRGRVRVSPASAYADPSLNPAQQDDELSIDQHLPASQYHASIDDVHDGSMPVSAHVTVRAIAEDYYVFCVSHLADFRLFSDFDKEACLVVNDPTQFIERFREAVQRSKPSAICLYGPVFYRDPFEPYEGPPNVLACKHFRFRYQREYRLVWKPDPSERSLEAFFVEMGSLEDIAEIVEAGVDIPTSGEEAV